MLRQTSAKIPVYTYSGIKRVGTIDGWKVFGYSFLTSIVILEILAQAWIWIVTR